jgi:D-sedoheptulose 7-phosphate isomerase
MDLEAFFAAELDQHAEILALTRAETREPFVRLVRAAVDCVRGGGKLLFFGNGGSAADAQHLATELAVRYVKDRAPIPAIALTTDTSALTAIVNDMGAEPLFARQVQALGRKGDLAIGISTSGTSPNIIAGLEAARQLGLVVAGMTGKSGGKMLGLCDPLIRVPSTTTARIQEMHITLGQMLCGALELELGLV